MARIPLITFLKRHVLAVVWTCIKDATMKGCAVTKQVGGAQVGFRQHQAWLVAASPGVAGGQGPVQARLPSQRYSCANTDARSGCGCTPAPCQGATCTAACSAGCSAGCTSCIVVPACECVLKEQGGGGGLGGGGGYGGVRRGQSPGRETWGKGAHRYAGPGPPAMMQPAAA